MAGPLLASALRRPGRLLLTGLAVLVATAFAAGTLLLAETMRGYVAQSTQETPAGAAVVVRPALLPGPVDPARLAALPGVAGVAAVGSEVRAVGGPGGGTAGGAGTGTLWEVTTDPMTGPLTRLAAAPERGALPATDDEVLVGRETAARTGVAPGDVLAVEGSDGIPVPVTVSGIVAVPGDQVDEVLVRPGLFARLGGEPAQYDLAAAPGVEPAALAARVGTELGAPGAVRTADEQRVAEAREASASVTAVLVGVGVFAGLALVAAAVVVASTFRIVLTQRRTQLALLRCVGAGRGRLVGAVLAEAALTGLVAGVLGTGAAVLAGTGLLAGAGLAGVADPPELVVPWAGLAGCVLVAVLATVLAALAPALAAARVPPVAALGSAAAGESGAPRTGRRLVVTAALVVLAVASAWTALLLDGPEIALALVAASGLVAFAAIVAAGPLLVRVLAATAGRVVGVVGGAAGRLATANAAEVPRRTAATVSVLALGVGLTSALLVGLASTEADAQETLATLFPTDVVVGAADGAGLADALRAEPALVVVRDEGGAVYVDPAPGRDPAEVRDAVARAVAGRPGVLVEHSGDARAELETVVLALRLVGLGLVGMTLLVAVVGVAVTLALSVTERTREIGLLRAVGLTRRGVRATVAWEAALSGTGAGLLGAAVGAGYGVVGLEVLDVGAGFVPASLGTLAVLVVGVVLTAVLAATSPAVRAGRVPPIRALQDT